MYTENVVDKKEFNLQDDYQMTLGSNQTPQGGSNKPSSTKAIETDRKDDKLYQT